MAASGGGVLQMIRYLVARDFAAGRLVPVLEDWLYPGQTSSLSIPGIRAAPGGFGFWRTSW